MATADDVVALIERQRLSDSATRSSYERSWFINHANYLGFQWLLVDGETGDTEYLDDLDEQVRFRANIIQSNVALRVAKLTKNAPDWDVDSAEPNLASQAARNIGEKYLEFVWDSEDLQRKSKELFHSSSIHGTSFFFPYWDPSAGKTISPDDYVESPEDIPALVNEAFDGDLSRAEKFLSGEETLRSGAVKVKVLSPFQVHAESSASDESELQWVIISNVWNIDEIERRFGKQVQAEDVSDASGPGYQYRLQAMVSPNVSTGAAAPSEIKNSAVVSEYYERPSKAHKNGRLVIYASGTVLYSGSNPNAHTPSEIPIVRYRDMIVPGRFWGQAALEQLIPLQRHVNKTYSDIIQNQHDHAMIKWMAPRGSGLKAGALDRRSDEVLEYNLVQTGTSAIQKPERIDPGVVPAWVFKALDLSLAQAQEVMGTHEVSKGSAPPGVESGVAIQLLQDADDTQVGSILQESYSGHSRLGMMILSLVALHGAGDSISFREIAGEDSRGEVLSFQAEELNPRTVRVRIGSLQSRTRAGRRQMTIEAIQYGLIDPSNPDEKRMAFNHLGFSQSVLDPLEIHRKRALSDIKQIESGIAPQIYPWTNTQVHVEVLEQRMTELDFEGLPEHTRGLFINHWQQLKQLEMADAAMGSIPGAFVPGQPPQPELNPAGGLSAGT